IAIEGGTLRASYDGRIEKIDPAVPFADPRLAASLTGTAKVDATVRELLIRTTTIEDYEVSGTLALRNSTLRDIHVDSGRLNATLRDSTVAVAQLEVSGPAIEGRGAGRVVLADDTTSD